MTGYGHGDAAQRGFKFTVELNSVNRRQSDVSINLPRELVELEPRIRDEINTELSRGRVNVVIAYHRNAGNTGDHVALDEGLAQAYLRAIRKLQKTTGLNGSVTLDTVLRAPGVLTLAEPTIDAESVWPCVRQALRKALAQLVRMRKQEGRFLARDLSQRLDLLKQGVARIRKQAPATVRHYREQLLARVAEAGLEVAGDDDRLMKEVVMFADQIGRAHV